MSQKKPTKTKNETETDGTTEVQKQMLALLERMSDQMGEVRSRVDRLETNSLLKDAGADEDTTPPWGKDVEEPFTDVDWDDESEVAKIAAAPVIVFLRRGSSLDRNGKTIRGPKPGMQIEDLETAFAQKAKFQEIEYIEWLAKKVATARRAIEAKSEQQGLRLPYHWGPRYLSPDRIFPKGVTAVRA